MEGVTLGAGQIAYSLAAQPVVLPLENKMRSPQKMIGYFGVISTVVSFVCIVYLSIALLGYVTFGDNLHGSITLNLSNSPLDFSVKIMLIMTTLCGFPLDALPISDVVWPPLKNWLKRSHCRLILLAEFTYRYAIVMIAFTVAYFIRDLKKVLPLVGCTTGAMLALVFPAVFETVVFWDRWKRISAFVFIRNIILNIIYILVGLTFFFIGTYCNISGLLDSDF